MEQERVDAVDGLLEQELEAIRRRLGAIGAESAREASLADELASIQMNLARRKQNYGELRQRLAALRSKTDD